MIIGSRKPLHEKIFGPSLLNRLLVVHYYLNYLVFQLIYGLSVSVGDSEKKLIIINIVSVPR